MTTAPWADPELVARGRLPMHAVPHPDRLSLDGRLPAREGAPVFAGEAEIGRVTSGGFSPTLGHPIAMATVATDHAASGTPLSIEVRGRRLDATVVPLPFVPHRYHRQGVAR